MPQAATRLADTIGFQPGLDQLTGLSSCEIQLPLSGVTLTAAVVDTGLVQLPSRFKTLAIVVDSAITSSAAQQFTVQLFAARTIYGTLGSSGPGGPGAGITLPSNAYTGSSGAASSFPTGTAPNTSQLIGSAQNFGPSGTSIAAGIYWFSTTAPGNPNASPPTTLTELTQIYPCLGVEIKAPAAPTGGAYRVFFEVSPI